MSELSFLLMLLLDHKLSREVKALLKERIKEIESKPQAMSSQRTMAMTQSPSTLANIEASALPPPIVPKRIVGGEVDTGNGTRGPRKF